MNEIPADPGVGAAPDRGRRMLIVALVVTAVVALAVGGGILALRPAGPPEAPGNVEATADLCSPPQCDGFTPTVSLTWTAPVSGEPASGFTVVRDGETLDAVIRADETSFIDRSVVMDERYGYRIVAHSVAGDSPPSAVSTAELPIPPLRLARLDGPFRLRIVVERATNLGLLEGIRDPEPGDTDRIDHRVFSTCAFGQPACPVSWSFSTRPLRPIGLVYRGSFVDVAKANCFGSLVSPVRFRMSLRITGAQMVRSAWSVTSFTGGYTISFRCPGALISTGTISLRAQSV